MHKDHTIELRIRPDLLGRILASWEYYRNDPENTKAGLTSYWNDHRRYISLIRTGPETLRVTGRSGFYFPGDSYNGSSIVNALVAYVRFRRQILRGLSSSSIPAFIENGRFSFFPSYINYDWLKALDHIATIRQVDRQNFTRIAEIGSGTGILALAFKRMYPGAHYTCVDLPETLHLACCFLASTMPQATFVFPKEFRDGSPAGNSDFIFADYESTDCLVNLTQELYINTDSMQEMSIQAIRSYFSLMRRTLTGPRLFYQSNRESKRMDEDVIRPVQFPWENTDHHLFFRENMFMRYTLSKREKNGIPLLVPLRRKHIRSLTSLSLF